MPIAFLLSTLFGAMSDLSRRPPEVLNLDLEGILFPILFRVLGFLGNVELFKMTRQCLFDAFWAYMSYRSARGVDWNDVRSVALLFYQKQTGNLLSVSEEELP